LSKEKVICSHTALSLMTGGSVHANHWRGDWRPVRTAFSILWCRHTYALLSRQGTHYSILIRILTYL